MIRVLDQPKRRFEYFYYIPGNKGDYSLEVPHILRQGSTWVLLGTSHVQGGDMAYQLHGVYGILVHIINEAMDSVTLIGFMIANMYILHKELAKHSSFIG